MDVFNDVCGNCNGRLRGGKHFKRRVPHLGGKLRLVCPPCKDGIDAQTSLELLCSSCRRAPAETQRRVPLRGGGLSVREEAVCESCAVDVDRAVQRLGLARAA